MSVAGSRLAIRREVSHDPLRGSPRQRLTSSSVSAPSCEESSEWSSSISSPVIGSATSGTPLIDGRTLLLLSLGLEDDLEEVLVVAGRAGHPDQGAVALLGEHVDPAVGHVLATRRAAVSPSLKAEQLEQVHHCPVYAACPDGKQGPREARVHSTAPLGSGQVVRQLILDQPIRGSNPLSPAIVMSQDIVDTCRTTSLTTLGFGPDFVPRGW